MGAEKEVRRDKEVKAKVTKSVIEQKPEKDQVQQHQTKTQRNAFLSRDKENRKHGERKGG